MISPALLISMALMALAITFYDLAHVGMDLFVASRAEGGTSPGTMKGRKKPPPSRSLINPGVGGE